MTGINNSVTGLLDAISNLISYLPGGPLSDLLAGALQQVRRSLLNQGPTAETAQTFIGEPPDFQVVGAVDATDPEGDQLVYTLTAEPIFGTVSLEADGSFTYTPNDPAKFQSIQADEFTVAVSDRGFNLLDPFNDRTTSVQITVGPATLASYSQGFDIINLTNKVLWLTKAGVNDKTPGYPQKWVDDSCKDNFCVSDLVGQPLKPGEALYFEASTGSDLFLYMMFSSNEGENWGVRVLPRFSNSDAIIDSFYADNNQPWFLTDRPDYAWPLGETPGVEFAAWLGGDVVSKLVVDWSNVKTDASQVVESGSWASTPLGPIAYSTENGNRLFLTNGGSQSYAIGFGDNEISSWSGTPPKWCDYCSNVGTVSAGDVLNNFLKNSVGTPKGEINERYKSDFKTSYANVTVKAFAVDYAVEPDGGEAKLLNTTDLGTGSQSITSSVEVNPGAGKQKDPNAPWWKGPLAQGAGALASFLLGKFVGDSIAGAIGEAVKSKIEPGDVVNQIKTTTETFTVEGLPHSYTVARVANLSRYYATGDVTFTINANPGGTSQVFSFKNMDFVVNDPVNGPQNNGPKLSVIRESEPYQAKEQGYNVGFRLSDKASWKDGIPQTQPTYSADPVTEHPLGVEAFVGAGQFAMTPGAVDYSGRGCTAQKTTNCVVITSDDPTVAEVRVDGAGYAYLVAKKAGKALLTAVYTYVFPGSSESQPLQGSVEARMTVTVRA